MKNILLLLLMMGCANTPKQAKNWKQSCKDTDEIKYCVTYAGGSKPQTVLYLHGLGEQHQSPKSSVYPTGDLVDLIKKSESSHIVNISFGRSWMLKPNDSKTLLFKKTLDSLTIPKPIIGIGVSMGGANMVTLNYAYPNLLKKMIFINPMILREHDYEKKFNILDPRNPGALVGSHYSRKEWKLYNPFVLGINGDYQATICRQDQFGLFEPAKEFFKGQAKEYDCDHLHPNLSEVVL